MRMSQLGSFVSSHVSMHALAYAWCADITPIRLSPQGIFRKVSWLETVRIRQKIFSRGRGGKTAGEAAKQREGRGFPSLETVRSGLTP